MRSRLSSEREALKSTPSTIRFFSSEVEGPVGLQPRPGRVRITNGTDSRNGNRKVPKTIRSEVQIRTARWWLTNFWMSLKAFRRNSFERVRLNWTF